MPCRRLRTVLDWLTADLVTIHYSMECWSFACGLMAAGGQRSSRLGEGDPQQASKSAYYFQSSWWKAIGTLTKAAACYFITLHNAIECCAGVTDIDCYLACHSSMAFWYTNMCEHCHACFEGGTVATSCSQRPTPAHTPVVARCTCQSCCVNVQAQQARHRE